MKIIERFDGRQVIVWPDRFYHIKAVHGDRNKAICQERETKPSYFTINWWPSAIYQTIENGQVRRRRDEVEIFTYSFNVVIGFNPKTCTRLTKVLVVVRRGELLSAYPFL